MIHHLTDTPFLTALQGFTALSFLAFGAACLFLNRMRREFHRYGIPRFRVLTGVLQLLGAVGLLFGQVFPWIGLFSATGLFFLMVAGVILRRWIQDTWMQTLPAAIYLLLSLILVFHYAFSAA